MRRNELHAHPSDTTSHLATLLTDPRRFLILAPDKTLLVGYETFSSYIIQDKRLMLRGHVLFQDLIASADALLNCDYIENIINFRVCRK